MLVFDVTCVAHSGVLLVVLPVGVERGRRRPRLARLLGLRAGRLAQVGVAAGGARRLACGRR